MITPKEKLVRRTVLALVALGFASPLSAQREAVLKQIDVPHPYYFREMYLPQLTTGPSGAAWMPDDSTLVYSMRGSLWRQSIGVTIASQLTAGGGYDYQPDVSPDGKWVAFDRYDGNSVELELLELSSGRITSLTSNHAVNLEPRWSPDGSRLAFVSTA
jgi:TolB protein